nr:extracellular solute-binding protein [Treponema sp.]
TGVTLKFYQSSSQNVDDDIDLMIANNSYTDFIFAKSGITRLIEAGAVIPLDEYISKYGNNIKQLYKNEIVKLRNTIDDPQIYTVGTYEIKSKVMETSGNIQIQNAVLKEFGYPSIKTLEDLENLLKAYIKKYPEINGHKTQGISLLTDSWYWYVCLSNPGNFVIGYPDDGQWIVNQNTLEASYKFLYPEMKIFYKWLNKIYHQGLLDPESFTQDLSLWKSKLENGYVLATSSPDYLLSDITKYLNQNYQESRTFAYLPVMADLKYTDQNLKDYGYSGGWGIAISSSCKDKVNAFKFLDWMCSEEAQILTNWGIENIDYYYEDGIRTSFPNIDASRGVGKWVYPFPQAGEGYLDSTGNPMAKVSRSEIIKNYTNTEKDTLNAYGVETWADLFTQADKLKVSKHGQVWQYPLKPQMNDLVNKVDEYVKSSLIKMIVGPENNFDKSWEEMKNTIISMGIKDVEEEITKLIQMKIKLWSLE